MRYRYLPLSSSVEKTGMLWNLLHPMLNTSGSLHFSIFLCHRCFLNRHLISPLSVSCGVSPPITSGILGSNDSMNSAGTPSILTRQYIPCRNPSYRIRPDSPSTPNSSRFRRIRASFSRLRASTYSPSACSSPAFPTLPFFESSYSSSNSDFLDAFLLAFKSRSSASVMPSVPSPSSSSLSSMTSPCYVGRKKIGK